MLCLSAAFLFMFVKTICKQTQKNDTDDIMVRGSGLCPYDKPVCGMSCEYETLCLQGCFSGKCFVGCMKDKKCKQKCGFRLKNTMCRMNCRDTQKCHQICLGQDCNVSCEATKSCSQVIKTSRSYPDKDLVINQATCQSSVMCHQRCEFQSCVLYCDSPRCHLESRFSVLVIQLSKSVQNVTVMCNEKLVSFSFRSNTTYALCSGVGRNQVEILSDDLLATQGKFSAQSSSATYTGSGIQYTFTLIWLYIFLRLL